ncbi:MAG: peptidylprolyl isomerase [Candidatus Azotimanducaceae bacterium]
MKIKLQYLNSGFVALLLSVLPLLAQSATTIIDRIAIVVDEDVIMQSELEERFEAVRSQISSQKNARMPSNDVLNKQIEEQMIIESLQLQRAERAGIRISDEEINNTLAQIAKENNLSLNEFQDALTVDGISWSGMRSRVSRELKINRLQQGTMRRRIQVSDQEIKNFLSSEIGSNLTADQYRLGHILIPIPENPSNKDLKTASSQANSIFAKIEEGDDFRALALEFSSGQNSLEGGDLGWRKAAQLPTIFSDLVDNMEIGETRSPIRSGRGFHILKLFNKRGASTEGKIAQTRVRHVLVQPNEIRSENEANDLALSLRTEVLEGRDFEEIAKLYSDDPGSALSGGDLGWSRKGIFVPEFEKIMADSQLNELSSVFKTVHGYHFLEVTGRRIEDFSERYRMSQAENFLRNQRFDQELSNWLREIREDAFIESKN